VTEFSLRVGERTAEDFLRHFSCSKIMISLASRPLERARIVSELTGVHERVANKLSPENAGETLQIALDEGVTTPKDIVRLFQPDDRQRYLDRHELWAFDISGEAWKVSPNDTSAHSRAERFTAYIMDRALENLLISHQEIVSALGVVKLAGWLPSELLGQIIESSLKKGDKFTEEDLLGAAPPSSLVTHVPLDFLWERVIVPLIAEGHDYAPKKLSRRQRKPKAAGACDPTRTRPPRRNPCRPPRRLLSKRVRWSARTRSSKPKMRCAPRKAASRSACARRAARHQPRNSVRAEPTSARCYRAKSRL
jgi:hypothetical protein